MKDEAAKALLSILPQQLEKTFPLEPIMLIDPLAFEQAFFPMFLMGDEEERKPYTMRGDVAVVEIRGPLNQRKSWLWDGYDAIRSRFEKALGDPKVKTVAMQIDSPGGSCAGCFEAARAMRASAKAAGKPVIAYADETAASAAYALATAADEIYLPPSGTVGSVGVLAVYADQVKLNEKMGLNVHVLTSGKHKADGHPDVPLTKEVLDRYQARIESLGDQFHNLVAGARGVTPDFVESLEAGVFHGAAAVERRLADGVASFDEFLRIAAEKARSSRGRQEKTMNTEKTTASGGPVGGEVLFSPPDFKSIALALSLSHDAPEAKILDAIAGLRRDQAEAMRLTGKPTMNEALGAIQAGQIAIGQLELVQRELAGFREKEVSREVDAAIEAGKREGKIVNEALESEMRALGKENPARLRSVLSTLPTLITRRQDATTEPATEGVSLTLEERQVARQMGISEKEFLDMKRAESAQEGT